MTKHVHRPFLALAVMFWIAGAASWAQEVTHWTTLDGANATGQPLPGVTVQVGCEEGVALQVLSTDVDGRVKNPSTGVPCEDPCWATFSFVGYETVTLPCQRIASMGGRVVLTPQAEALDAVVVTASISGSSVQEETVPVTVLKPYLAETANALDLKGLVSKTPGVSILDGQVSIRGGSGYSYGVGSRVQMLLDGLPLLSGDLGEIWWSYLPMEHVGQVEVVKATASSMYGLGASNGVIHMRTVWPGEEPETVVSVFNGVYSDPDSTQWRWWDQSYSPISNGMSASHRQAFGKLDIVAGEVCSRTKPTSPWDTSSASAAMPNSGIACRPNGSLAVRCKANISKWDGSFCGTISPRAPTCPWTEPPARTDGPTGMQTPGPRTRHWREEPTT